MIDKNKIRVIKQKDRPAPAPRRQRAARPNPARQVVSNVSEWVSEVRERKAKETRAAIDTLFGGGQRLSES